MQIVGKAMPETRYPADVLLMAHRNTPDAVAATGEVVSNFGVEFATTTSPALATWLAAAINALLDGAPLPPPRPAGTVVNHGCFFVEGRSVSARDWHGRGQAVEMVRCAGPEAARQLAARLNRLLS